MQLLDPQEFWDSIPDETSDVWPVICLDFNGVFDQYPGWEGMVKDYPPAEGIEQFLFELTHRFNTIVVCSATLPISRVSSWLYQQGLAQYIDYVTNHKPPSTVYVDDKAVTHRGDFKETLEAIEKFIPHWA